jgi:quercetin dioxygenase-like cupin family protein
MHVSRLAGVLLVSIATLAQQQPVPITSEPSHHMVIENQYVRVFDVTVAPKATTLVHQHDHDYLFVTLGDSDVISARTGAAPAELLLKDGETRFTPGNFSHAAINKSDKPFHNITIELLQPSTHVKSCGDCRPAPLCDSGPCATMDEPIVSDQWIVSSVTMRPGAALRNTHPGPVLFVAINDVDLAGDTQGTQSIKLQSGKYAWITQWAGILQNRAEQPARYVTLEFKERPR